MNFCYIRVSTQAQHTDRQKELLKQYSIERVFEEKITGTTKERPQLIEMMKQLRAGDTVYIESFSRLARNTKDLISIVEDLGARGIEIYSHKEQFDTSTSTGKLMLTMFAALAQFERDIIADRTKEGLEAARARGKKGGRKSLDNKVIDRALKLYNSKTLSVSDICITCNISKPTLYRYINERRAGA